jgi:hypothetical protein
MPEITQADREAASKLLGPRMTASGLVRMSYQAAEYAFAQHREAVVEAAAEAAKVEATRAERERIVAELGGLAQLMKHRYSRYGVEAAINLVKHIEALGVTAEVGK